MCGIAVAVGFDEAQSLVGRMLGRLSHRGDISDPIVSPRSRIAMGTRRLRIIDAERGQQPKSSFDGRLLVVFNGEIYNHADLRRELAALGARFESECDTEVVANALLFWGLEAFPRFNGMFAFVAIDVTNGWFIAARDAFGVKPLYLMNENGGYLFCSEIRPLLEASETGDVMFIPPGHFLTPTTLQKFETPASSRLRVGGPLDLDDALRQAVHRRVPSDLPTALLFSGGIDSTLAAHYAREAAPKAKGFFLGGPSAPDFPFAAAYADLTGMDLEIIPFSPAPRRDLERMTGVVEALEAFDPSIVRDGYCNHVLFEKIHQDGFRVALSGEGADELFAGYEPIEVAYGLGDDIGTSVRAQTLDLMHRSNLQRLDRCGMRFQVEAREPFLDPDVVAFAERSLGSAADRGRAGRIGKADLRALWALYPNRLPAAIGERKKTALHVGSGLDASQKDSPWSAFAQEYVSDSEFADGRKFFAGFGLSSKEELLYLRMLAQSMDVFRVPHLAQRPQLKLSVSKDQRASVGRRLHDYVA